MKRILSFVLCVLMTASAAIFTASAQDAQKFEIGDNYISFDFNDITGGIVNGKPNATVEKNVTFEGKNAVKFTPTPDTYDGNSYTLDCWSLGKYAGKGAALTVPEYKYMGVTYYYAPANGTQNINAKMKMSLLPGSNKALKSNLSSESHEPIVAGKWAEAYFDFSTMSLNPDHEEGKPYLVQCHFQPFGTTALDGITANDVLYVAKYTFYKKNPNPDAKATVSFLKGIPDATGNEETKVIKYGEKFTLPENPFKFDSSVFLGWKYSVDEKVYPAGTELTVESSCSFTAQWDVKRNVEDIISLKYVDYSNEIVNGTDVAFLENTVKDGREVVMCTPNPNRTATGNTISLDGYKYVGANIDLNYYHWFAVEYFYQSPNPHTDLNMRLDIMTSNTVLTKTVGANSSEPLVANTWALAVFDMTAVKDAIHPDNPTPNMKQMHLRAYGLNTLDKLTANDVMYISRVMFFTEKPDFVNHASYMNGYTDGTFKPAGTMTRAEACTVVARLLEKEENISGTSAFADVANHWAAKYIGYCEARGLLNSYSGSFEPDKAITRAEFSELVYLTGLAKDKGINAAFTDVANSHPRYASIMAAAKAGLINGYAEADGTFTFKPDNTITRAEVVTVINRARETSKKTDALTSDISVIFLDVEPSHWAYADIAEATVPHVEQDGKWLYPLRDPVLVLEQTVGKDAMYDIEAGKAKIAELDILEQQRIAEIKATPNMDLSKITGKKIYVSPEGNDNNDGLSEATPVKTAKKAASLARPGDAVLFKRGGEWFEKFNAKENVTYTAYGEGAKPVFNGSYENGANPEMWELVYENKETGALIWKFKIDTWKDVGTIVFNGGEGYAYKDLPDNNKGNEYTVYKQKNTPYDYTKELDRNFEFFHHANNILTGNNIAPREAYGPIYLRCDNGNPGKVFDSVEFITYNSIISCSGNKNITIDNLCFKNSNFGIGSSTTENLTVTNCEFYWIGGSVQTYTMRNGVATRFGNAIEIYGGVDGFLVDNCYFYQVYDAAVTHQVGDGANTLVMNNITYSNNVMDMCQYSIEYFFGGPTDSVNTRKGVNVVFENNLMRRAGYGFGSTRRDINSQRHIRSGGSRNEFTDFVIRNNVMDRSVFELAQTTCHFASNTPTYDGNTYIQGIGNQLYSHGTGLSAKADISAAFNINRVLGDKNAKVYFTEFIPLYEYSFNYDKKVEVTEEDRARKFSETKPGAAVSGNDTPASPEAPSAELTPEPGESTEIKAPMFVRSKGLKEGKLYAELRKCMKAEVKTEGDIMYSHITFVDDPSASVNFDCYGTPKVDLTGGVVYYKFLMRTNYKGGVINPIVYVYSMTDADGNKVGNGVTGKAVNPIKADGNWEEVIVKVTGFPDEAANSTQIHFMPLGSVKGTTIVNDANNKDAYVDLAAWAPFSNLASAKAYDLKADAK